MGIKATDKNRNLFLKGFRLSQSGMNEDPTYLGFKVIFDFGNLPVNPDTGLPPSPLLRRANYTLDNGASMMTNNPFGQPQYDLREGDVTFYSAYNFLKQREANFGRNNTEKRANAILQFQKLLQEINTNSPWFFQSIEGLDELGKISRGGFQNSSELDTFDPQRTIDKTLTFNCLESINLRMNALADLYHQAVFDADNMRWLVPRNLRKFTMWIFVTEIRNFFKTSRLAASSTALAALDDLSSTLTNNRNPGSSIVTNTETGNYSVDGFNLGGSYGADSNSGNGSSFTSFVSNVFDSSGLQNEAQAFRNQQDQTGIKPVLIYECSQCEFDFSDSSSIKSSIDNGSGNADPETQSFKIYVGKVRTKNQYPNIRQDGKPLILADGWDQDRSSVQNLDSVLDIESVLGAGSQLLTNFVSSAVSDLVNEGINQFVNPLLSGVNQSLLGNIYSFNPVQLGRMTNERGNFGFNNAENFLNGAAETGIDNIFKGNLPTPQKTGQGGPPERVYPVIQTDPDVYKNVPGSDLGVPGRVYPAPSGDAYTNVPGSDLGVPNRVYSNPSGDAYSDVPGADLGVPDRVYPAPGGDAYAGVPGADLGVPDRAYPAPGGDVYDNVPGSDLGVPDRVYPVPGGDVYANVPGSDLGVPDRNYTPNLNDDVYSGVPGQDLGVPNRSYRTIDDDVYTDQIIPEKLGREDVYKDTSLVSSNGELRSPENTFTQPPGSVYDPIQNQQQRGILGKVYPQTSGDFIIDAPINLGNAKPADKYNISLGDFNPEDYPEQ